MQSFMRTPFHHLSLIVLSYVPIFKYNKCTQISISSVRFSYTSAAVEISVVQKKR